MLDDSVVRDMKYRNVLIEVITPELHVFAQYTEDETELLNLTNQLRDQMKTYGRPSDYRPRKGYYLCFNLKRGKKLNILQRNNLLWKSVVCVISIQLCDTINFFL